MEAREQGKKVKGLSKQRPNSGVSATQIINATLSLDLSYIQKHIPIQKKPYATHGEVITEAGELIGYESNYGNEEQYSLEIHYCVSHEKTYSLTVELLEVSSNLGKGCLLYFICPVTGRKCRKLYKLPFSDKWASRAAFKGQLYYPIQICSRLQRYPKKFFEIKKKYHALEKMRNTEFYAGRATKRYIKTNKLLLSKQEAYDKMWSAEATPHVLKSLMSPELIEGLQYLVLFA